MYGVRGQDQRADDLARKVESEDDLVTVPAELGGFDTAFEEKEDGLPQIASLENNFRGEDLALMGVRQNFLAIRSEKIFEELNYRHPCVDVSFRHD